MGDLNEKLLFCNLRDEFVKILVCFSQCDQQGAPVDLIMTSYITADSGMLMFCLLGPAVCCSFSEPLERFDKAIACTFFHHESFYSKCV